MFLCVIVCFGASVCVLVRVCVFWSVSVCFRACMCLFFCVSQMCVYFVFVMFIKFFSDCVSEALKLKLVITHGWRNNETSAQLRL